jgi:hypothetical protein
MCNMRGVLRCKECSQRAGATPAKTPAPGA